jgi:cell division protein FtsI/penicillin-binding protein 2
MFLVLFISTTTIQVFQADDIASDAEDPRIAVAVMVENGGNVGQSVTGNELAAPIAKQVIEAYLR